MSKMRFTAALIDDNIVDSKISHDVRFCEVSKIRPIRKAYMKSTQMVWINTQCVIDCSYIVRNPSALIFLFLN